MNNRIQNLACPSIPQCHLLLFCSVTHYLVVSVLYNRITLFIFLKWSKIVTCRNLIYGHVILQVFIGGFGRVIREEEKC